MGLWQGIKAEFVDVIEWSDPGEETLVWRFPSRSRSLKLGSQLTVRPGQWAVFVNEGRIADSFGPGRYRLDTRNMPLLTTLLSLPYGFETPFLAEVLFVATRQFTNRRWGTRHPLILRDPELGPVRLRGFGTYVLQVVDPKRLIEVITGTDTSFSVEDIGDQLRNLIATRLADLLGECETPVLDLSRRYDELAAALQSRLEAEVRGYGLELASLLIENLTLPPDVEAALDRRSSVRLSGDLGQFQAYQQGIALEKAAANPGGAAGSGLGLAMGMAMGTQPQQPPPAPAASEPLFHVLVGQESEGPMPLSALQQRCRDGGLTTGTLVWRAGLTGWTPASAVPDLAGLFAPPPPPPPPPGPPPIPPAPGAPPPDGDP
ncbi:DUF4339 domain-containing protein [Synechococcus sp. RSCCF101]|uniref:SPFH domain-containing protein n=1 Tax=Synechococcus sp. RSCCF101 TaxID=2511069 RepID=UPI0012455923|nr:SPFH domain-containing protein [Synechococcus sp. RSCCF101]QEY32790.1 DUF4339 domain-containing protein [Synechococcus sp. RSCCF101]